MKQVKEFMNKEVVFLSPDNTIFEAAKLLAQLDIAGAPVVDKDKVVGVISISDIIRFIDIKLGKLPKIETPGLSTLLLAIIQMKKMHSDFQEELKKITSSKVKEVMSKNVITVPESASLVEVAELMEKHGGGQQDATNDGGLEIGEEHLWQIGEDEPISLRHDTRQGCN